MSKTKTKNINATVLYSEIYDKLISVFLEGRKRTLSKPIIKKDPITPDILNKIIDTHGKVI
jgi:hypothetical protein